MTTNKGYIHIVLYDIPSSDLKGYRKFRKKLLSEGYYQLQESVYCSKFKEKKQAEKSKERIYQSLPKNGDVRSLILTTNNFNQMEVLLGQLSIQEKILKDEKVIKI